MTSTENAPRDGAPRWFQRVLPVAGMALAVVALAAVLLPGLREQVALSASHRPQEYVELYFARTPAGTQLVCTSTDESVRVSFAVTSHLEHDDELAYDVVVGDARQSGAVAVEPGQTVEVTRSVPRPAGGRYDVAVRLPGSQPAAARPLPGGVMTTRVAVVTPRFPPDAGGVEEYAAWVARTLQGSGAFEVVVITTGRSARTTHTTYDGIPVIRLGTWLTVSNTPLNPLWWWQVRRLLARLDVDVVNAHAPVPGLADVAALTARVPVVLTYHAGSLVKGDHPVDPLLRAYERRVLPRVFDRCAELVAVSPVSLAHRTGRAHLIPPGVDTDLFSPSGEARERRVLYVGRVERTSRWKGLHVLVDALPRLREQVPDARLEIVGDGDDVEPLQKRAADLGVADLVDWRGHVDHDALPPYYRRAGVTVLPSLTESESFGMALAEAMACGCRVVGSAVGGIPYVVRDGVDGRLVPPGDPVALADALAAELLEQVPAEQPPRWSWEQQVEQTVHVITEVAR